MNKKIRADGCMEVAGMPQTSNVIAYRNEIYFYDDVTDKTIFELRKCLLAVKEFIESEDCGPEEDCAVIFINSYGGEFHAGMAGYSMLKNFPHPVFTVIEGGAASAATFLYVAGEKKFMYKNSFMLIHQLSREMMGKYYDLQDDLAGSKKFMDAMSRIYLDNTKIKEKDLEKLISRELWLTYKEAKDYGLVDDFYDTFTDEKKKKAKEAKEEVVEAQEFVLDNETIARAIAKELKKKMKKTVKKAKKEKAKAKDDAELEVEDITEGDLSLLEGNTSTITTAPTDVVSAE